MSNRLICFGCNNTDLILVLVDVLAGVPLMHPVAGIAMGLILEPDGTYVVLSDILGSEDALGDMDFKVKRHLETVNVAWRTCKQSECTRSYSLPT